MLLQALPTLAQSDKYVTECVQKHHWTETDCRRLYRHEVWTGMTNEMAAESLGQPINSNSEQTLGRGGTSQIIYRKWSFNGVSNGTVTLSYDSKLCRRIDDPTAKMANIYSPDGKKVRTVCIVTGIQFNDVPTNQGMKPRFPQE